MWIRDSGCTTRPLLFLFLYKKIFWTDVYLIHGQFLLIFLCNLMYLKFKKSSSISYAFPFRLSFCPRLVLGFFALKLFYVKWRASPLSQPPARGPRFYVVVSSLSQYVPVNYRCWKLAFSSFLVCCITYTHYTPCTQGLHITCLWERENRCV